MSRQMLAALVATVLAACGGGDARDTATADSLSRDLRLAPADTTAELADRPDPATDTATAAPAPAPPPRRTATARPRPATPAAPAAPAPSAAPAAPREPTLTPASSTSGRALDVGTTFSATTNSEIRSHKNKVGDEVTATVANDVKDSNGRVVIPAGSDVTFRITAIKESENKRDSTGTLTLQPASVSVNGQSYTLNASIKRLDTKLVDRKTNAGDIAKVGAGTAAGAVVGRVLGGSTKGAIIGGVIGGAVGTQRAVETQDRDVVVPEGTTVVLALTEDFARS